MIRRGGKELEYLDRRGNRYGQRQFDSLLPLFYARQLVADGRFPDSIAGRAVSPREAQAATFVFRSTPQDVNTPVSVSYTHLDVYKRQLYGFRLSLLGIFVDYRFFLVDVHVGRTGGLECDGRDASHVFQACLLYTSRCV